MLPLEKVSTPEAKTIEELSALLGVGPEKTCKMVFMVGSFINDKTGEEEDKLVVARARKVERFLSQPFSVAEVFTGSPGKYVPLKETIRGFKGIINGEYDNLPEQAFYMVGTIDEAVEKAKNL